MSSSGSPFVIKDASDGSTQGHVENGASVHIATASNVAIVHNISKEGFVEMPTPQSSIKPLELIYKAKEITEI